MAIFSSSSILPSDEVQFLLDLLPKFTERVPDVYIIDRWETVASLTRIDNNLCERYKILKGIVHSSIFSTYNFQHNIIFIYLFNLPYRNPFQTKLHAVFCLFHEIRHHQQFVFDRNRLLAAHESPVGSAKKSSSYSYSWVEKDANKFAVKWMRRNRKAINEKFKLHKIRWDVGVNDKRLRIIEH